MNDQKQDTGMDSQKSKIDVKKLFAQAMIETEVKAETPVRRLARKMINEERKYLFSDQKLVQRRKNIKEFIEEARKSGDFSE